MGRVGGSIRAFITGYCLSPWETLAGTLAFRPFPPLLSGVVSTTRRGEVTAAFWKLCGQIRDGVMPPRMHVLRRGSSDHRLLPTDPIPRRIWTYTVGADGEGVSCPLRAPHRRGRASRWATAASRVGRGRSGRDGSPGGLHPPTDLRSA